MTASDPIWERLWWRLPRRARSGLRKLGGAAGWHAPTDLEGDRDVEWGWVAARLSRYCQPGQRVLDFGAGSGVLSIAAAGLGAKVVAIDLMPMRFPVACPGLETRQVDLFELSEPSGSFDLIVNCSTVEHVGLAGRYGARAEPDGDLRAMRRLLELLRPGGAMLLTIPVGIDQVVAPLHRIYGPHRLPLLLAGWRELESDWWVKRPELPRWAPVPREEALALRGGRRRYALGCLALSRTSEC